MWKASLSGSSGGSAEVPAGLELTFVMSRRQNAFFFEIVAALRYELGRLGVRSRLSTSGFPTDHWGSVFVLFPPHEYCVLEGFDPDLHPELLARTVVVCAEQPESEWFDGNVRVALKAGAVFDISLRGAAELRRRGLRANRLELGYTPVWDRFDDAGAADRPVDVLFLGAATPRRLRALARCGDVLWPRASRLIISDHTRGPNDQALPNFIVGERKRDLLRRSRVLLNIHRSAEPYFEWVRAVEAFHCGAVLVTESSVDYAPLVPGRHFLASRLENLPDVLEAALDDEERLGRIRRAAYELLRTRPLADTARQLAETAATLTSRPVPRRRQVAMESDTTPFTPRPFRSPPFDETVDGVVMRAALKEIRLDLLDLRREVRELRRALADGETAPLRVVAASAGYRAVRCPRLSVITALYNQGQYVQEALDSVRLNRFRDVECVVVDDGSTDDSAARVQAFVRAHPEQAVVLLAHGVNRGLPRARNAALAFARGEYAFVLDADNAVYPTGLEALVATLDGETEAAVAYGMLQCFDASGPRTLLSHLPWEPERLRAGNYIDAMAMFRTSVLRSVGGYTTDRRLYGWEDYDLWCTLAERGYRGVLVPSIVGRYRMSPGSMLAVSNVSLAGAYAALAERHAVLLGGGEEARPGLPD